MAGSSSSSTSSLRERHPSAPCGVSLAVQLFGVSVVVLHDLGFRLAFSEAFGEIRVVALAFIRFGRVLAIAT